MKNNISGESPAESDYQELGEIFEKMPDMNPVCQIETKQLQVKVHLQIWRNCKRKRTFSPPPDCIDAVEGDFHLAESIQMVIF